MDKPPTTTKGDLKRDRGIVYSQIKTIIMSEGICKICGKSSNHLRLGLCRKHYEQFHKYGKVLDSNRRSIFDDNEIRIYPSYGEIDTYSSNGTVDHTYKFDLEDIKYLKDKKWRSVKKGKGEHSSYYLVTGHIIYFHRLIMNNPKNEIDHINRDSTDNRKTNLRISCRTQQLANTCLRSNNTECVKGVYYDKRNDKYHAEISIHNKRYFSKTFSSKDEAVYMRYLMEKYFYKEIGINDPYIDKYVNKINLSIKNNVLLYFKNKVKAWV